MRHISSLKKMLKKSSKQDLDNADLHQYIDDIQLQLARIHGDISSTYFPEIG